MSRPTAGSAATQAARMSMVSTEAEPESEELQTAAELIDGWACVLLDQQGEEAGARATATTDGYQLFQKGPVSDLSPRQLCVRSLLCVFQSGLEKCVR